MSVLQTRGGIPRVFRDSIDTTGRDHSLPFTSSFVIARNRGTTDIVRMYFLEDDFDNDENYVELTIPSAATPYGEWSGPVEAQKLWFRAAAGSEPVEVVVFQRRG